jgi:signal transduction histidine kinase
MESQNFDFAGWIKDQDGVLGILGIKLKPYKEELSTNELHLLNTILNQLALTMKNIILMEDQVNLEKAILKQEKLSTLGQISASISHEVKNPLHSIYTLVQVMEEDEPTGDDLKNDLKTIRNEIEDLTDILNEILLYASPNKHNIFIKVNVSEIIEKTIRLLSKEAQNSGIKIVFNPKNEIIIKSNPGKLKEIIFNLILNGIQACDKKGDLIQIESIIFKKDISIKIIDNGPGIDNLKNVFEPFFTTKEDGTGLGLSIVKTKVEELSGEILVQNRTEGGAEFIVKLPFGDDL